MSLVYTAPPFQLIRNRLPNILFGEISPPKNLGESMAIKKTDQKRITYHKPKLSITSKQVSRFTSKIASNLINKAISTFVKHQSQINSDMSRRTCIMNAMQSSNVIIANGHSIVRKMVRARKRHERLVAGYDDGFLQIAIDWIADYLMFVLDVIWGIIRPIIMVIFIVIMQAVVTVVVTGIIFYMIYKFITI